MQLSKDGVPVLYRPSDLKALTNKTGKISDYTLAELSAVDAGWSWGGETHPWRGKGVTIPTLKSVLETATNPVLY